MFIIVISYYLNMIPRDLFQIKNGEIVIDKRAPEFLASFKELAIVFVIGE